MNGRRLTAASFLRHLIEQEVGEGEAGEGAGVVEVAEDPLVAGIRKALVLIEPAAADLELMPPGQPRELVGDLQRLDVVELGDPGIAEADVARC